MVAERVERMRKLAAARRPRRCGSASASTSSPARPPTRPGRPRIGSSQGMDPEAIADGAAGLRDDPRPSRPAPDGRAARRRPRAPARCTRTSGPASGWCAAASAPRSSAPTKRSPTASSSTTASASTSSSSPGYPHLEEAYWFGEGVMPVLRERGHLPELDGGPAPVFSFRVRRTRGISHRSAHGRPRRPEERRTSPATTPSCSARCSPATTSSSCRYDVDLGRFPDSVTRVRRLAAAARAARSAYDDARLAARRPRTLLRELIATERPYVGHLLRPPAPRAGAGRDGSSAAPDGWQVGAHDYEVVDAPHRGCSPPADARHGHRQPPGPGGRRCPTAPSCSSARPTADARSPASRSATAAWTLQPHPEFIARGRPTTCSPGRIELIGAERVAAARTSLARPLDQATVAELDRPLLRRPVRRLTPGGPHDPAHREEPHAPRGRCTRSDAGSSRPTVGCCCPSVLDADERRRSSREDIERVFDQVPPERSRDRQGGVPLRDAQPQCGHARPSSGTRGSSRSSSRCSATTAT